MPWRDKVSTTATFQFVMRTFASGEFAKLFERESFEDNFRKYYGQRAIKDHQRKALKEIMNCDACIAGLRHIHTHFHENKVIAKNCENSDSYHTPYAFFVSLVIGVLLLLSSVATLKPFGLSSLPEDSWITTATAVLGLAGSFWILYGSRYDKV